MFLQLSPGSSASYCSVTQSSAVSSRSALQYLGFSFFNGATLVSFQSIAMVRTRGGSRLRPRVRFSTPEREEQAPIPAPVPELVPAQVPEAVSEEPQGFRRYQTRMGPRAPSPVPQRRSRRARPSKQARTSGPGESSSSRPPQSPATSAAEATSSPQLSPASRIRGRCSSRTPSRGMYDSTVESSIRSHTTMSWH